MEAGEKGRREGQERRAGEKADTKPVINQQHGHKRCEHSHEAPNQLPAQGSILKKVLRSADIFAALEPRTCMEAPYQASSHEPTLPRGH
eukprot:361158-Chlamydomonas_euryale.AAC.4